MKERTDELLCTEIFGLCFSKARTINEITFKIYKSDAAKNLVRVYQCCDILMERGLLVPKFIERKLLFQIDQSVLKIKDNKK
jgi:hypothetical protein